MNKFVVLFGPTAVGKTDFSLELARKINAEIINMDTGQFYEPFSIGTAKPDWKNSDVMHHLFDVLTDPRNYTVVEYAFRVKQLFCNIWSRGKIPLLVGGSGFYLYNLLFPVLCGQDNNADADFIQDGAVSWDLLYSLDPERAKTIHPNDTYRIARAFFLYKKTNKTAVVFAPQFSPVAPCCIIYLSRDTEELNNRIHERTASMFEQGFVSEVRNFLGTPWESFMLQKKLIGYNEVMCYLKNQSKQQSIDKSKDDALQEIKDEIVQKTRQYAKRQRTFWRYLEKKIQGIPHQKECRMLRVDLSTTKKDLLLPTVMGKIEHYL
jgi:tRNA dimethylallyltransferase